VKTGWSNLIENVAESSNENICFSNDDDDDDDDDDNGGGGGGGGGGDDDDNDDDLNVQFLPRMKHTASTL
jgi:hypothetical protein